MAKVDFLQPETTQIRHQIRGILESYSHDWDLLSELAQNAIDAIRMADVAKGKVQILIDAGNRKINITDNGIGINPSEIQKLLRPFGTDKVGKGQTVGEKGVGLKFVIFSSSAFSVRTSSAHGSCIAKVDQASAWVSSSQNESLSLDLEYPEVSESTGTTIEAIISDDRQVLFDLSFEQLIFLMLTKTALGDTGYLWNTPLNAEVDFQYIDKGGKSRRTTFDCKYLLPIDVVRDSDAEDMDSFKRWLTEGDHSDQEKRKRLFNKIVWTKGKSQRSGRELRYWSCFVPKRSIWDTLSEKRKLVLADPSPGASEQDSSINDIGFSGGFNTSTKGMPTGISIELRPRGSAGYLSNFFIIVDDPSLKFDIGRKSVHGRQQGILKELAYENFREFISTARKYMGGDIDPESTEWDRDELFESVESLPDLCSPQSRFLKRPNTQEATVAAMFFERLGRGEFPEIKPLISGYKNRYDLFAKWKARRVVIEFKYDLAGLFRDFNEERKMFDEINAVVIWEVTEADRILAKRKGIGLDVVLESDLVETKSFPGATKRMTLGDVKPVFVVELKRLLEPTA